MIERAQNLIFELSDNHEFVDAQRKLEEINRIICQYEPLLREKALAILLSRAFGIPLESLLLAPKNPPDRAHLPISGLKSLVTLWSPKTQPEQALLAAYYAQEVLEYRAVTGRQIQTILQKCDLPLTNVTVAAKRNLESLPPLMKEVKVRGRRRHFYIVTREGIAFVENKMKISDVPMVTT